MDLVELTTSFLALSPKAALMALVQSLKSQVMQELYRRGDCTVMVPQGYECQAEGRTPVTQALSKFGKTAPLAPNHAGKGKSKRAKDGPYDNCPPIPDGPKEPPLWQSTDFCSGELWRFDQVVSAIAGQQTSQSIQYALDVAIHRYKLGPSGFPEITPFVAKPHPASHTQSYLTPTAQALYDEIVLALNDRTLNWGTALKRSYTRNAGGQIKRVDEVLEGYTVPARLYDYNNLGQLTKVTIGATSNTWDYDANGNRTHENGIEIAKYDNQDRLLTWRDRSYTYNAAGDLETRTSPAGTTNYVYDALGALRVVRLPDGKTITYDIDPSGRRTGKRVDGQQQWHLVWQSQLKPIAQLKPDGSIDAVFYYAEHVNVPSAMRKGGKDYQIVTDHLGSVRLVIDVATAQVVQRMDFDAWGYVTEDSNPGFQPFGFAGGLYDPDTQLTRFGARDYDAEVGRWTLKDPILFEGGDSNLYGYVFSDSVNLIDYYGYSGEYLYSRQPGGVHHQINNVTVRDLNFSAAAISALDKNPLNNIPLYGSRHDSSGGVSHYQYNQRVKEVCVKWLNDNKIDPTKMTAAQANKLAYHIRYNPDPKIAMFNRPLYMRWAMMQARRSTFSRLPP